MNQKDILEFLGKKNIPFELIKHREVYTADKIAKACKVPEKSLVKGLFLKVNGKKFVLAVLSGNMAAKLTIIKKFLGAKKLELASEQDMKKKTGFKPGAAPSLGKFLKVQTIADEALEKTKSIVSPAGDYKTCIKVNSLDWFKLETPEVLEFSVKPSKTRKKKKSKKSISKSKKKVSVKKRGKTPKTKKKLVKKRVKK